jgi:glycerol-3-phosphate acyltransferase PlsX
MKIIVDAMGGDNAPQEIVKGALRAYDELGVQLLLVGREEAIRPILQEVKGKDELPGVEIHDARDVITMEDDPSTATRRKKDSSMAVALTLLKDGQGDALVSAGSTGALLTGATLTVKRIKGIRRAALAPVLPAGKNGVMLIDCGANVDARAEQLVQFARMGSIYAENALGIEKPRVGIVNIGAEEEKGNALVKETIPLLKECDDINFIGCIESRDIPFGAADVILTEAFVGNVILKLYEGEATFILKALKKGMLSNTRSKLGAMLLKPALKEVLKDFDVKQYGGAPLLGLNGLVVKTHGSAESVEVRNSILQCRTFKAQRINEKIKENMKLGSEDGV